MQSSHRSLVLVVAAFLLVPSFWGCSSDGDEPPPGYDGPDVAQGFVFHDVNGNGARDSGEPGIEGVRVSDQRSVTVTDEMGRWVLPEHEEAIYFVVKPRGYRTALSENNLPLFYHVHKNTAALPFAEPTVQPTGPLPESIDFGLIPQTEPDQFKALFLGDPQPRSIEEVDFLAHDVLEEMVGTEAGFAVVLGDISYDNKETYLPYIQATGRVGVPFYNVTGNHDANYEGMDTHQHYDTWRTIFGPRYYSFDYGPVHFMILADVAWPAQGTSYVTGLGREQLAWIEADLAHVPTEKLVVLAMHIPLTPAEQNPDFARLYELLQNHPHTLSFSAHSHTISQGFITEEFGWKGPDPHHHIVSGATCGAWWEGPRDETDIPHATGSDGSPNGYFVASFDGTEYSTRFKAARRPADYQMQIQAPEEVAVAALAETPVILNYFSGTERAVVEMSVGKSGDWVPMEFSPQRDPLFVRLSENEGGRRASVSRHIWEGRLPADLPVGGHLIRIRTVDMYGQKFSASRIVRVKEVVETPDPPEEGSNILG